MCFGSKQRQSISFNEALWPRIIVINLNDFKSKQNSTFQNNIQSLGTLLDTCLLTEIADQPITSLHSGLYEVQTEHQNGEERGFK